MEFQGSWRSTVTFHAQDSGFLKALLWVVTTSGTAFVPPPPGLSTEPNDTLALGWKGGLPPRKMESLTPRRVRSEERRVGKEGRRRREQADVARKVRGSRAT